MARYVLLQDPYHAHAARFIELFERKYGMRAICFYTDVRQRIRNAERYPLLSSASIETSFDIRIERLADFAVYLKSRYEIAAVIPFSEPTVLGAIELARRFDLPWAQPEIMRRFRDKFSLKEYLRRNHPALRMTASCRVNSLSDIKEALALPAFNRFVLKPNGGYGNRSVGLFMVDTDNQSLQDYLNHQRGEPVVMEEYVEGVEYFVNGQMDAVGNVTVIAVFEYQRIAANERHNIDYETKRVASTDPRFRVLSQYACQVMLVSGLRRSPFHIEIKIDERGPCLIEVGARLVGHGNAELCGKLHGALDLFDLAAHYYLNDTDYGTLLLNWQHYDAMDVRYVHGIAKQRERIYSLQGIGEIEAMPEFAQWAKTIEVGMVVDRTIDSLSMPYSVVVQASSSVAADTAVAKVRQWLTWNQSIGVLAKTRVLARVSLERYYNGLRVRVLSVLARSNEPYRCVQVTPTWVSIANDVRRVTMAAFDAAIYRLQLRGARLPWSASIETNYEDSARAPQIVGWAESYLAQPHPMLGRKGAVCPFVQHTIDRGGFVVSFHDEIDGRSLARMRRAILDEAVRFQRRFPRDVRKGLFSSVVMVFTNLPEDKGAWVDRMHDELKTHFMKLDLMCSPSHKYCTKPSVSNPEFEVFRSPFAGFVVRHMDVRDIAFLGHNREAFTRYQQLFAEQFAAGTVNNDHGYVDMYEQACRRFA